MDGYEKGYMYTKANPEKAITHLSPHVPERDRNIDLLESQKYTAKFYGKEGIWGVIEPPKVAGYLRWLKDKDLE